MKTFLVVTITCPDRPGIVEQITQLVLDHTANWEDSRMARLGGHFAGIVLVSVPPNHADALTEALRNLADDETAITVKPTRDMVTAATEHGLYDLTLSGADHEGIVHKVSAFLAGHGINLESLETTVKPAPMSAAPLFHMSAVMKVPLGVPIDELARSLRLIGDEVGVDIEIERDSG